MSTVSGMWDRLCAMVSRRREPLDRERTDLVVVVSSFDDAEACSTALARGAESEPYWSESEEAVLRHHLSIPPGGVDRAVELAAQDGYTVGAAPAGTPAGADGHTALMLQRVQVLDAMHCAQEKSRMVSLAQRLGGTAHGWDALQPPQTPG
ncbi:hypothetical protein ACIBED_04570 [Rhodococcus coprophilus]|nr:hypothetical protein [Rhodococcus coprophilus]MBM7460458.1 hypothetical protein [Rhodococcus coprophilus]